MDEAKLVLKFISLVEHRDLDAARAMMATSAQLIFPGGKKFGDLEQLVKASSERYREIRKTLEEVESFKEDDAMIVVYIRGTLEGTNNFGVKFSGIRFIDRFVVQDGLIQSQEVWNDLAESGALVRRS